MQNEWCFIQKDHTVPVRAWRTGLLMVRFTVDARLDAPESRSLSSDKIISQHNGRILHLFCFMEFCHNGNYEKVRKPLGKGWEYAIRNRALQGSKLQPYRDIRVKIWCLKEACASARWHSLSFVRYLGRWRVFPHIYSFATLEKWALELQNTLYFQHLSWTDLALIADP